MRRPEPPQRIDDGTIEACRQIACLVEAAAQPAPRVQRHRHHIIAVVEQRAPCIAQQPAERIRERSSSFVLECVDDIPERAFVAAAGDADSDVSGGPLRQARRHHAVPAYGAHAALGG